VGRKAETTTVEADDVVAFGRFGTHGDAVARLLVRLRDGREFQVAYADQSPEATSWLRSRLRKWRDMPRTSREIPWSFLWQDAP
jgi:hypothetical protein